MMKKEKEINKNELRANLKKYVETITQKSRGTNMYVCPLCGSGNGKNHTGAFSVKDGVTWKCFSCGAGGDIFDLIGKIEGICDYGGQLKRAAELFGSVSDINDHGKPQGQAQLVNYTDFFLQAHSHLDETDYPGRRGLSRETADRFNIGFVRQWTHPKAPGAPPSPRLIIPTGPDSYLARDTREEIPQKQKPYAKSKVGKTHIFNSNALENAKKPIFIVEGELDALSVIDVGGEAVALGSTAMVDSFAALLKTEKPGFPLILALDNDKAGREASEKLEMRLKELEIPFYRYNPYGESKDANEALVRNRQALRDEVAKAENAGTEDDRQKKQAYLESSAAYRLQDFVDGIADSVNTSCLPTGFEKLDRVLDGGLYEGLYIIGAISSLGKTTFVIETADRLAESGVDVLIFSLEMSDTEIMAKSISRHTIQRVLSEGGDVKNAKTARGITTGKRYAKYSRAEMSLITEAMEDYRRYACHIYISEGIGDIGTEQIRQTVKEHILYTGNTPVIVIDYLQILAPYSERATDKQNTDKAVMELKRISRDYKTPVLGISSFNRSSYSSEVAMEAFKESGAIEYSSDVLLGFQLRGAGEKGFDVNAAKRSDPREVELVVLKNRNGRCGDRIGFNYYPMFNYFTEE